MKKVNPSFVVGIDPNMQNRGLPPIPPPLAHTHRTKTKRPIKNKNQKKGKKKNQQKTR